MGMNYSDLPYKHNKNCTCKDSSNTYKMNVGFLKQSNKNIIYHYDVYCKECGVFLYEYDYGNLSMY